MIVSGIYCYRVAGDLQVCLPTFRRGFPVACLVIRPLIWSFQKPETDSNNSFGFGAFPEHCLLKEFISWGILGYQWNQRTSSNIRKKIDMSYQRLYVLYQLLSATLEGTFIRETWAAILNPEACHFFSNKDILSYCNFHSLQRGRKYHISFPV